MVKEEKTIIYTDGGARNNPGPAAIGVVIEGNKELRIKNYEYSKFIGQATNNEAEYQAVIFALKKLKHLIGSKRAKESRVEIRSDSELLINQLNACYKIKEKSLALLFVQIWNLRQDFGKVDFIYIKREENKKADNLVNEILDAEERKLF